MTQISQKLALLTLVVSSLFGNYSTAQMRPSGSTIVGTVLDTNGNPVQHAKVYATPTANLPGGRRIVTATDKEGHFVLENVTPGEVMVHAYKEEDGYPDTLFAFYAISPTSTPKVNLGSGQKATGVVIRLGPKYAILEISIEDQENPQNYVAAQMSLCRKDEPTFCLHTAVSNLIPLTIPVPPVPISVSASTQHYAIASPSLPTSYDLAPETKQELHIKVLRNQTVKPGPFPPR